MVLMEIEALAMVEFSKDIKCSVLSEDSRASSL
jgi:hypothetical protein